MIAHRFREGVDGRLVASFPVDEGHEILLVTDGGQLLRMSTDQVRQAGRATQGVRLIRTGQGERVVAAERLEEVAEEGDDGERAE